MSWLKPQQWVEVRMEDEGLIGSRYEGQVVRIGADPGRSGKDGALVRFLAFNEEQSNELLCEWVALEQLSPPPPPAPEGFVGRLQLGDPLEVRYDDGWWEVTLRALTEETGAPTRPESSCRQKHGTRPFVACWAYVGVWPPSDVVHGVRAYSGRLV